MSGLDVFVQRPVFATHTHPDGFRSGQWAEVLDLVWFPGKSGPHPLPARACFRVRFVDGRQDLWPVDEAYLLAFRHFLGGQPIEGKGSEAAAPDDRGAS